MGLREWNVNPIMLPMDLAQREVTGGWGRVHGREFLQEDRTQQPLILLPSSLCSPPTTCLCHDLLVSSDSQAHNWGWDCEPPKPWFKTNPQTAGIASLGCFVIVLHGQARYKLATFPT